MIHIEKGQRIIDSPHLKVASATGNYDDVALIEFFDVKDPDTSIGALQAQCVKYGNMVYRYSDPVELGKEILKIDPESTHNAAAYVRMNDELLLQMNNGDLTPDSLKEAIEEHVVEPEVLGEETEEEETQEETEEEEEEETTVPPLVIDNPTTTPSIITTTSTPTDIPDITTTTSTPAVDPVIVEPVVEEPIIEEETKKEETVTGEIVAYAKKKVKKTIRNKLGL